MTLALAPPRPYLSIPFVTKGATMADRAAPTGSWQDWFTDRALRLLIALALALPLRARLAFMGWLISRVVAPLVGYEQRALDNLSHVWPEKSAKEHLRIARAAANNAGRTMIENYDVAGLLRRMGQTAIHGDGLPAIEAARAEGRPVIFITGHFGNFEAPRAALVARGYEIGGLYRPMSNPYFNDHYARNMHALSDPVFEQGRKGTMGLYKHIRNGGMGVLLFDIFDSSGVPIPFLGQPAPTVLSAAEIALKTGALLVPFFGVRAANGRDFEITFEAPIPEGSAEEMMRAATQRLEAQIMRHPGQWFWIHRRWKPKRQAKRARKAAEKAARGS